MAHVVPGFVHVPGVHCGSTAMADVFRHGGHDLGEAMCFGLGAGLGLAYLRLAVPSRAFHGRTLRMEEDLCAALGAGMRVLRERDAARAWARVRAALDEGRPVVLQTDVRFLPHYRSNLPFNGHRVVLCGYDDDEAALIADTQFEGFVRVPQADLRAARGSDGPPAGPSDNLWWEIDVPARLPDLGEAARAAMRRCGAALRDASSPYLGLRALADFADELPRWRELPDAKACAHFGWQVIERRGTGGGLFRRLYHRFLVEAQAAPATIDVCARAADAWSELADHLRRIDFAAGAGVAARLLELERELAARLEEA